MDFKELKIGFTKILNRCVIVKNKHNYGHCFLRSKYRNNKYYAIVQSNQEINSLTEFRSLSEHYRNNSLSKITNSFYNIIELIIDDNDVFFIENYGAISGIEKPKYKIIHRSEFENILFESFKKTIYQNTRW